MPDVVDRYRVRRGSQEFTDRGPDLLRTRDNGRRQLRTLLGPGVDLIEPRYRKGKDGDWVKVASKGEVLDAFDDWRPGSPDDLFQVAEMQRGKMEVVAVVRREDIKYLALPNSSPGTCLLHSLITHQFPGIRFAGAYVYKQIAGSSSWSDHAWGTADDETENKPAGVLNDEVTEWLARMARSGNLDFDYALGSRGDDVVSVSAPDFDLEPSGAADTHLWHNHVSVVDHDGRKPPRTGGVF